MITSVSVTKKGWTINYSDIVDGFLVQGGLHSVKFFYSHDDLKNNGIDSLIVKPQHPFNKIMSYQSYVFQQLKPTKILNSGSLIQ